MLIMERGVILKLLATLGLWAGVAIVFRPPGTAAWLHTKDK